MPRAHLLLLGLLIPGPVLAQTYRPPSKTDIEQLKFRLKALKQQQTTPDFGAVGSPSITIANPNGFGADNNTFFVGLGYQSRIRPSQDADGGAVVGVGLLDARKSVGVEVSYALTSITGRTRPFGSGSLNVKVHHQFDDDLAVAVGWDGLVNIGQARDGSGFQNDLVGSVYGVATKIFRLREDVREPFSRLAVTAGVGTGQFRSVENIVNNVGGVNAFGSLALRVAEPLSAVAEWTGQDLSLGLSVAPFPNIPFVISPAFRDVAGAGNGARFVLGSGFAFQF